MNGSTLHVYKAQANRYNGYDGNKKEEIVLFCKPNAPLSFPTVPFTSTADQCILHADDNRIMIKVPLVTEELHYFYANYKDYYYLPAQDQAIHKSIASFVDKAHREQAHADNCYTRKAGTFLPEWNLFRSPFFKRGYRDKTAFFLFDDTLKTDRSFWDEYASYVFDHIMSEVQTAPTRSWR